MHYQYILNLYSWDRLDFWNKAEAKTTMNRWGEYVFLKTFSEITGKIDQESAVSAFWLDIEIVSHSFTVLYPAYLYSFFHFFHLSFSYPHIFISLFHALPACSPSLSRSPLSTYLFQKHSLSLFPSFPRKSDVCSGINEKCLTFRIFVHQHFCDCMHIPS